MMQSFQTKCLLTYYRGIMNYAWAVNSIRVKFGDVCCRDNYIIIFFLEACLHKFTSRKHLLEHIGDIPYRGFRPSLKRVSWA